MEVGIFLGCHIKAGGMICESSYVMDLAQARAIDWESPLIGDSRPFVDRVFEVRASMPGGEESREEFFPVAAFSGA